MARARTTTPSKPDDVRAQRSIDALRMGLLDLLEEKPLEEISIKEITDRAGLSYPTFFRRFASKGELLEDIAAEEVRMLLNLSQAAYDEEGAELAGELCRYVHERRSLWTILLNGGAAEAMRKEFQRMAAETAYARQPRANPWLPVDLAISFTTSGIFEIFAWWMRQPPDYPLEKVVQLYKALIIEVTHQPRGIRID